jgi:hypothetical protein
MVVASLNPRFKTRFSMLGSLQDGFCGGIVVPRPPSLLLFYIGNDNQIVKCWISS